MDIGIRILMDAEEFLGFLGHASGLGCSIHHEPVRGRPRRVEANEPLPEDLRNLLRSPLEVESPHILFVQVDGSAVESQRTITAYFGGVDAVALYLTSVSVRSIDEATLAVARRLKRFLVAMSRTGLRVIGGRPAATVRFTKGAELAVEHGIELSAGGNVRYEIM